MTGWKKYALMSLGYLVFTAGFFVLSLYFTFDPNIFAPAIVSGLQAGWPPLEDKRITIEEIRRYRLIGLELRGIKIAAAAAAGTSPDPDQPAPALVIDRLAFSPRLLSLPRMVGSLQSGQVPEISLSSYTIDMAGGSIKGRLETGARSFLFEAKIKEPLAIEQIRFPSEKFKEMQLAGKLSGEMSFRLPDLKDPGSLKGEIKIELDQPSLKNLTMAGLDELVMDSGTLIAKMEGALLTIETLKLQGADLPLNLQGTINYNEPFRSSLIDVKGSIQPGQSFRDKNPITASLIPDNKNFVYSGPIDTLLPGMF